MSEKFKYKYEAPTIEERKEIDSIRREYLPKDESMSKLERLRYLNNKVKSIPTILGLCLGIGGLLLFGTGMTFFLEWTSVWYFGVPFVVVGIIVAILAYPIYTACLKKLKNKYSQEILALSNELLDWEDK